jgi:large repetitive protein
MFTASNGVGTAATQNFTLTVNTAPVITSANSTTFTVGTAGTFTVTATGTPAPTFSETGMLPTGVTFNTTTGVLSGTPAAGTGKTYPIMFTASNGVGSNATQNFTLTVDQAPMITSANSVTFTVGSAGSFTVMTSGFPPPALSDGGAALPGGVTFVDNGDGTGKLSGTPASGSAAMYPIKFHANSGYCPRDHQWQQHDVHRWHRWHVHSNGNRHAGADVE